MSSQSMLYWSAKPVDSHVHLSSVLLALLKRWELKEAPRAYRSSAQRRSESQSRSQIPRKRNQRQAGDIDCCISHCSTRFVMHFDSAVRAAFSHALTVFPVQKPRMRVMCAWDFEEQESLPNAVALRHPGAGRSWGAAWARGVPVQQQKPRNSFTTRASPQHFTTSFTSGRRMHGGGPRKQSAVARPPSVL